MTDAPRLTDRPALARFRARASRSPVTFLHEEAAADLEERLAEVNRRFTAPAIVGGFLQVGPDKVVVMAETADMASEIDLEKAQDARREAERALESGFHEGADLAAARAPLQQALLRIQVAERRRREGPRSRG